MSSSKKKRLVSLICCCAALVVLAGAGAWAFIHFRQTPEPIPDVDLTTTAAEDVIPEPVDNVVVPAGSLDITPMALDSNQCVAANPSFLVALSEPMGKKVLEEWLKASPPMDFTLKATKNELEYQLTPKEALEENTLYTFTFDPAQESAGMPARAANTWAFQTGGKFAVKRTMPEDQGSGIPVNSAIEIAFTGDVRFDDVRKNVSFKPALKGADWRKTGVNTYAFLPEDGMAYNTVYEVRVKGGLIDYLGNETLGKDYAFKFRTEEEENDSYAYSYYDNNAYMSNEQPAFSLRAYPAVKGKIPVKVFRYADADAYAKALETQAARDDWSLEPGPGITTAGLAKVLDEKLQYNTGRSDEDGVVVLPDKLPKGFYATEFTLGRQTVVTLFQVTDLSAYAMNGGGGCLFWVNDLTTKKPVGGAEVFLAGASKGKTDAQGTLQFSHSVKEGGQSVFLVRQGGNQLAVALSNSAAPEDLHAPDYWRYVYADKALYKPDDTLNFFGVVSPKLGGTKAVDQVTVVLGEAWADGDSAIRTQAVLRDGVFDGQMKLPGLSPGYYALQIYAGENEETWLGSTYFEIKIYQKPAFGLTLASDKYIRWTGEAANVTATAAYFDGTPLTGFDITIEDKNLKTDADGKASRRIVSPVIDKECLLSYGSAQASAVFPEIGDEYANVSFQYINSDVEVKAAARREKDACNLELQAFAVDFSAYEKDGDTGWDYDPFLKDFGGSLALDVSWTHITYKKVRTGEKEYDPYTKTFTQGYRYESSEKLEGKQALKLSGKEKKSFALPVKDPAGQYHITVKGRDSKGRAFVRTAYYYGGVRPDNDRRWIKVRDNNEKTAYAVGEQVSLSLADPATDIAYTQGTALFIRASDVLLDSTAAANNLYTFTFDGKVLPNINVYGVLFDGREYSQTDWWYHCSVSLDGGSRGLDLKITPDKESYRPGETAKLALELTDKAGKPAQGAVNLNMVDEAMLSLQEQYFDINESLFGDRYFFYYHSAISHVVITGNDGAEGGGGEGGGERTDFRDTALFKTVRTDKDGKAGLEVKLPDNITSWRVFWQAFRGDDVMAGSGRANIIATLPFFVDIRLAEEFLAEDQPILGLRSAGVALEGGDVKYTVEIPSLGFKQEVNAPVSVWHEMPMPALKPGVHKISVTGAYKTYTDTITKSFTVTESIADHAVTESTKLSDTTVLSAPAKGAVRLIFADKQKAQTIRALAAITEASNVRAEQVMAKMVAEEVLARFGAGSGADYTEKLAAYQAWNGSIKPFSYGSEEEPATLSTTVWACAAVGSKLNRGALAGYLNDELQAGLDSDNTDLARASLALAGLAALREPVVPQIAALTAQNMPPEQAVHLALANTFIGNGAAAKAQVTALLGQYGKTAGTSLYIDAGSREDTLRMTANLAVAAVLLDLPEGEKLFQYVLENKGIEDHYMVQQAIILKHMAQSVNPDCAEFTYTLDGEATHLKLFTSRSLLLTAEQLGQMRFSGVTDEIEASVTYAAKGFPAGGNGLLTVSQQYDANLPANKTAAGTIQFRIDEQAPDGYYNIVHVLPAGLAFKGLDWNAGTEGIWVSEIKGQQVTITVWKEKSARTGTIQYLARPAMTGAFRSEGTYIANPEKPEFTNQVAGGTVTIK